LSTCAFSINFAYQISFRALWLTSWLVNNAFQKECFGKFGFKIDKILKKSSKKTKKAQNVVFNLKRRISLLYYCVKHIYGQFKTYLKLRNIRFKQIAKTIPTVGKNRDILFKTILFCIL
jgi:hypothetical protein